MMHDENSDKAEGKKCHALLTSRVRRTRDKMLNTELSSGADACVLDGARPVYRLGNRLDFLCHGHVQRIQKLEIRSFVGFAGRLHRQRQIFRASATQAPMIREHGVERARVFSHLLHHGDLGGLVRCKPVAPDATQSHSRRKTNESRNEKGR